MNFHRAFIAGSTEAGSIPLSSTSMVRRVRRPLRDINLYDRSLRERILPLTINPPNVLIHRLPIALNRAQDIYILTFPSRFPLDDSLFVHSAGYPDGKIVRRVVSSKEQKQELAFGMRRVSSVCYFVINSRLALVTPFAFRDSGVPFYLGNTPYCPFYAGLPACALQKIFYSHRPIVRHCVPAHCVPLCSFIPRSVTR